MERKIHSNYAFKDGDKVRIRQWDDMEKEFGLDGFGIKCKCSFTERMRDLCGKEFIRKFGDKDCQNLKNWEVSDHMLELVEEKQEKSSKNEEKVKNIDKKDEKQPLKRLFYFLDNCGIILGSYNEKELRSAYNITLGSFWDGSLKQLKELMKKSGYSEDSFASNLSDPNPLPKYTVKVDIENRKIHVKNKSTKTTGTSVAVESDEFDLGFGFELAKARADKDYELAKELIRNKYPKEEVKIEPKVIEEEWLIYLGKSKLDLVKSKHYKIISKTEKYYDFLDDVDDLRSVRHDNSDYELVTRYYNEY